MISFDPVLVATLRMRVGYNLLLILLTSLFSPPVVLCGILPADAESPNGKCHPLSQQSDAITDIFNPQHADFRFQPGAMIHETKPLPSNKRSPHLVNFKTMSRSNYWPYFLRKKLKKLITERFTSLSVFEERSISDRRRVIYHQLEFAQISPYTG